MALATIVNKESTVGELRCFVEVIKRLFIAVDYTIFRNIVSTLFYPNFNPLDINLGILRGNIVQLNAISLLSGILDVIMLAGV